MDNFIALMAEIMELTPEEVTAETVFREECDFDSMMGFMMICTIEDEYGKRMPVDRFLCCETIGQLYAFTKEI